MKINRLVISFLSLGLLLIAAMGGGCGQSPINSTTTNNGQNVSHKATLISLTVSPETISTDETTIITIKASVESGGVLYYTFSSGYGTLSVTSANSTEEVKLSYTPPPNFGVYYITYEVQGDAPGTTTYTNGFNGNVKVSVSPWKEESTNYSGYSYAYAIDGTSINDLWMGYDGGLTHYNGSDWNKQLSYSIRDIKIISSTSGWATTGLGDIIPEVLKYNGSSWEVFYAPMVTQLFNKISYIDAYGIQWTLIASDDKILRYNGTTWETFASPVSSTFYAISNPLTLTDMWAVGRDGKIIRSSGGAWSDFASPTTNHLQDILMLGLNNGWAVGNNGTIVHWDGSSWRLVDSPTSKNLYAIAFKSVNEGWIGGNEVLLYYDGTTWQIVGDYSGKGKTITKLTFLNDGNGVGIINNPSSGASISDYYLLKYNL